MCLTAEALDAAGGFGSAAAEDQELGVRLFLAGIPVAWAHDIKVYDEKPAHSGVVIRQRARWASRSPPGRKSSISASFCRKPSLASVRYGDAIWSSQVGWEWHWRLREWRLFQHWEPHCCPPPFWAGLAAFQFLAPIPFLAREGVPVRYLMRYPLLAILPVIKVPARLIRQRGWYHTPHDG